MDQHLEQIFHFQQFLILVFFVTFCLVIPCGILNRLPVIILAHVNCIGLGDIGVRYPIMISCYYYYYLLCISYTKYKI